MGKKIMILAALLLLAAGAVAQDKHFDASVSFAGAFQNSATGNGITQSATNGTNIFLTLRAKFKEKHSVVFNYGGAKDSQIFQSFEDFHVGTKIRELSGAYMFTPYKKGSFEVFGLAGIAVLRFAPRNTYVILPPVNDEPNNIPVDVFAKSQSQPAFLYGVGTDYTLPRFSRFALRLQYRGFLYSNPDFKVTNTSNAISFFTGTKGHMAEPSIGLVFRF
jgi:opacity protein-like surface antigen